VKADKLYLVGFMGAGKTSVARALGRRMGLARRGHRPPD
jgi:shikimate kinase